MLLGGRGFPSGQRGGTQDPVAQASEGSNPSPRISRPSPGILGEKPQTLIRGTEGNKGGLQTLGTLSFQDLESSLEPFTEYLRDQGYRESTIRTKVKLISFLRKRVNLWDQEAVKKYIRNYDWHGKRKNNASYAYRNWCQSKGFDYVVEKAREPDSPLPYIPTETEIDQLIATHNSKYACFLQMLKESAFRVGEAMRLTPNDVDLNRQIVTLNKPEKKSRPRQFRMSDRLSAMIQPIIGKTGLNERIWNEQYESLNRTYRSKRKVLSEKLGNPNILKITFKTFRHWKATMEYHKTKDILHTMRLLGHKNIKNTLVYTHLVDFDSDDSFCVRVASNLKEFTELLENGFEYISDYETMKVLRKRK